MGRHAAAIVLLAMLALSCAQTVVLVNSNKWQDAYAASIYAKASGYPLRYIQDVAASASVLEEMSSIKPQAVEVYGALDNPVPGLTYRLRQMDLDIRDTSYSDSYELCAILAEKMGSTEAVIVRDDFAFDALSARYLAVTRRAPILYAKGVREIPQAVRSALEKLRPTKVYAVGRFDESVLAQLRAYNVEQINGRDEYDTTYYANLYAFKFAPPSQAVITSGDILELTMLNAADNPFIVVPDIGTYSLVQTSNLILDAKLPYLLGIGPGIAAPAYFIKERTGAKIYVKFGTLNANAATEGMQRQDIDMRLTGYKLPKPTYAGKIANLDADYGKTLGKMTSAVVDNRQKPAPPVDFTATFENTGNIEVPVYVLFKVTDKAGTVLITLQSEPHAVYVGDRKDFRAAWANPASEGEYRVEATFFTDVYEGIQFPGRTLDFDLRWLWVWIFLFVFILAAIMLLVIAYTSRRLLKDLAEFTAITRKIQKAYVDLLESIKGIFR